MTETRNDTPMSARMNANGGIEFEKLNTNQILAVLVGKVNDLDDRIKALSEKVDDKMLNMATKDDLNRFGNRMSKLESQLESHDAWIKRHETELEAKEHGIGTRFKNKIVDYIVMMFIALLAAGVIGGVNHYLSGGSDIEQLRNEIETLRKLK